MSEVMEIFTDEEFSASYKAVAEVAKNDLVVFNYLMYPQDGSQPYKVGALHEFLFKLFQGTLDGSRGKYQCTSVPPQHGKSRALTVRAVAWYLGRMENKAVALTGFSLSLLQDFLQEIREILESETFQSIFPNVSYDSRKSNTQSMFALNNGCTIIVKSEGMKLTGKRVDLLILDDVHAGRAEAESVAKRTNVIQWFFADCITRITEDAKIFLIGTRWHPQDLIGHLTSDDYVRQLTDSGVEDAIFEVVNIPAVCDSEEDPLGREIGEALFPEQRSIKFLNSQKALIPTHEWQSQYQGKPTSSGSDQIDINDLNYCVIGDVPIADGVTKRGWDFAVTEKTSSDFSAGALMCFVPPSEAEKALERASVDGTYVALPNVYIIDIAHHKLAWSRMRSKVIDTSLADLETYGATEMGMEAVSGFKIGRDELRGALVGKVKVSEKNPARGGKLLRAQPWLNLIEAGKVHLVRGAWNKAFVEELRVFPDGNHDDQVDAVSVAWETCNPKKRKLLLA